MISELLNRAHMHPPTFSQDDIDALGARAEAMVDASAVWPSRIAWCGCSSPEHAVRPIWWPLDARGRSPDVGGRARHGEGRFGRASAC